MGAPKRNRKHFDKPKERWNLERIKSDRSLINEYGLKNMKELWKVQTEVSRIRRNVRELLSASGSESENVKQRIISRLTKMGIANETTTLDNLLDLREKNMLDRRLQTIVFRRGMARSAKQARQITVHGFISVNGRKVNRPGYMVDVLSEKQIGYYKPIDVNPKPVVKESSAVPSESEKGPEPENENNA